MYDLYLKYESESGRVYPVPVVVLNKKNARGVELARGLFLDAELVRRFFLVDTISSRPIENPNDNGNVNNEGNQDCSQNKPLYIRYAKSIEIQFELLRGSGETGSILPPLVIVDYASVSTQNLEAQVDVEFKITYRMDLTSYNLGVYISIGILGFFSFVYAFVRIWIWNRRSGKLAPDMISLFKFTMFLCSALANSFFLLTAVTSIYWLIFFKGQSVLFLALPQQNQLTFFNVALFAAFALKAIDVVHLIFTQTSFDIFFVDWERPKHDLSGSGGQGDGRSNILPPINSGKKSKNNDTSESNLHQRASKENLIRTDLNELNKVSCWRTLFVANEWNEIQTYRKINPTIQITLVLFLLNVVNLEAFTTSDCNASISADRNAYRAEYESVLRVGMAVGIYLGVGLFQYILFVVLYIRCVEDRIGQFADFCSIANISMFIMTHTQFGYYIHGRSPHGNSDTSMQRMTEALLSEEQNMTARRGLEKDSDEQTFSISISDKLSRQYSKVMIPIYERKVQRTDTGHLTQSEFEKRMLAYAQLNKFLQQFINNILREMQYIVARRNFVENVMDFEFKEPLTKGYFYTDVGGSGYRKCLFSGQERKLFVFDLLLFLVIDFFARNYILAGVILYFSIQVYNMARDSLGRRNISRKTLVDKRFLI